MSKWNDDTDDQQTGDNDAARENSRDKDYGSDKSVKEATEKANKAWEEREKAEKAEKEKEAAQKVIAEKAAAQKELETKQANQAIKNYGNWNAEKYQENGSTMNTDNNSYTDSNEIDGNDSDIAQSAAAERKKMEEKAAALKEDNTYNVSGSTIGGIAGSIIAGTPGSIAGKLIGSPFEGFSVHNPFSKKTVYDDVNKATEDLKSKTSPDSPSAANDFTKNSGSDNDRDNSESNYIQNYEDTNTTVSKSGNSTLGAEGMTEEEKAKRKLNGLKFYEKNTSNTDSLAKAFRRS